ncbi:MAG: chemotaxis protein CheX [Proteobacteria bacterium]|nr:chemotaxis protein CheX [Pseudomonadota bacterium]
MKENMKKIQETMRLSIFEVFEKMFYIFLEPLDGEYDAYDMEAVIEFEGTTSGEIRLLLSRDVVKTMVENMLGLAEDEITGQDMEDCSKEAANMIAGNFLGNLDSTEAFNLSIPTFRLECSGLPAGENTCRMGFDSDGGKIGIVVEVK